MDFLLKYCFLLLLLVNRVLPWRKNVALVFNLAKSQDLLYRLQLLLFDIVDYIDVAELLDDQS